LIKLATERSKFRRNRKAPRYFEFDPSPVRFAQHGPQVNLGHFFSRPQVEITLFDFGACSVSYEIDINGSFSQLVELAAVLYDNPFLLLDARRRVESLLEEIGPAIQRPTLLDSVEDYTVYQIEEFRESDSFDVIVGKHRRLFAQVLRAESDELSQEEVDDATRAQTSYSTKDCAIDDWNAAFVLGQAVDDSVSVLEFCNVELLEMRVLDEQLDQNLETAYQVLTKQRTAGGNLRQVARLQVDSALLYEAVENAVKLLGDQYLARIYSSSSQKFHLPEWHSSIRRKLDTLDSIYQKPSDHSAQKRSESLEVIIIILILFEIVMDYPPKVFGS
jgi:hypothetical protein